MATRHDTAEFMEKAREYGLIDEMDRELEIRKNERRLAVIAKIKVLPTIDQTEVPALGKASVAAHKTLQLAEEAYRTADRQYKELSLRTYGAQNNFDGARIKLENEAISLAPDFLREAYEDLSILDGLVSAQFRYDIELVTGGWFGRQTTTTTNGAAISEYAQDIKISRDRITAMMLEAAETETAQVEALAIIKKAEKDAYIIGVSEGSVADRRKPVDVQQRAEDLVAKESQKRRNAAQQRSSAIASIQV